MARAESDLPKSLYHLITVGTTPPGAGAGVVEALAEDIRAAKPRLAVVLATPDSKDNADRLLEAIGATGKKGRVHLIESAQSIEDAYHAANEELCRMIDGGADPREIVLHFTAGTKVMSAGAVLAAINHEVHSLRYLYSKGRGSASVPITTHPGSLLADRQIRLASTFIAELGFRAAGELLENFDSEELTPAQRETAELMRTLAQAYHDWDNFHVQGFLDSWRAIEARARRVAALQRFLPSRPLVQSLEAIAAAGTTGPRFPEEVLIDLMNNAIRRLAQRRPDDALIRLHRAAELLAQMILEGEFGIRTDDVEIRKVPPRSRTSFEAERRLDDAKIKLGLRKSYELLEILGHPIGAAFRQHDTLRAALHERRNLILAHGTSPASMKLALDFYREVMDIMKLRIKDLRARAAARQFPWIRNDEVLKRLTRQPQGKVSVLKAE